MALNVVRGHSSIHQLGVCMALCALVAVPAFPQALATLEGSVRDSRGHPLGTVTVYLQLKATGQTLTVHTNPAGIYRFTALRAGTYLLKAEGGASGEASARSVILGDGETQKIDLTLDYAFFDEPNFIVAGVTDPISRGGHGSDTVLRSTEALAKATASLSKGPDHSLGHDAERRGDALEAARKYQRAAELDASEPNLFDWGTELLMHRAAEPATEVFAKGHRLFPQSLRLLLGLGRRLVRARQLQPGGRSVFRSL
jgi:hypothetical protein